MPGGPTGALRSMAKFDISPVNGGTGSCEMRSSVLTRSEVRQEANDEPVPPVRWGTEFTRMWRTPVALNPVHWGVSPQVTENLCGRLIPALLLTLTLVAPS